MQHQIALAVDRLRADGYPICSAKGYEADDVIASATTQALAIPDTTVLIATADKDLLQLVSERVTVKNVAWNGTLAPSGSTTFGFLGSWNGTNSAPTVTCALA